MLTDDTSDSAYVRDLVNGRYRDDNGDRSTDYDAGVTERKPQANRDRKSAHEHQVAGDLIATESQRACTSHDVSLDTRYLWRLDDPCRVHGAGLESRQ